MNPKSILTVPYRIARTPLAVLTSSVGARLPENSRPRLVLDRTLGTTDQVAGRLFGSSTLVEEGTRRVERSDKLAQATELEAEAAKRRQQARDVGTSGRRTAADKAQQARDTAAEGLEEADRTERRGKQEAANRARTTAARKKSAADARAKQQVDSIENSVERTEAAANARATQAKRRTAAKVGDAQEQRADADAKREEAEELGELADAKRSARKTD